MMNLPVPLDVDGDPGVVAMAGNGLFCETIPFGTEGSVLANVNGSMNFDHYTGFLVEGNGMITGRQKISGAGGEQLVTVYFHPSFPVHKDVPIFMSQVSMNSQINLISISRTSATVQVQLRGPLYPSGYAGEIIPTLSWIAMIPSP